MITLEHKKKFLSRIITIAIAACCAFTLLASSCRTDRGEEGISRLGEKSSKAIELQDNFRKVAEKVLPVVVEVNVVDRRTQQMPDWGGNPFPFMENPPQTEEGFEERQYESRGLGSGVIVEHIDNTVYIITNDHVVAGADEINVVLNDGREYSAEILGVDDRKDLALLTFSTEEENIPVAVLGNSDSLKVGDWVLAAGNPLGYESTVTAGIVSALGRRGGPSENISDFIQTDAAINQGNSGGALANIWGEVVGINTWITSPTGGSIGLGFSIPINHVKRTVKQFIEKGEVEYGWLGVKIGNIEKILIEPLSLDGYSGAFVYSIFTGSPADIYGIKAGDYIIALDGENIEDKDHLLLKVGDLIAETTHTFTVVRDGKKQDIKVKVSKRKSEEEISGMIDTFWPGMYIYPLTSELQQKLSISEETQGVFISGTDGSSSSAAKAGLQAGDLITKINTEIVKNVNDFYRLIGEEQPEYSITYIREGNEQKTTIER